MASSSNDLLAEGPPIPQKRIRNDRPKHSARQNELNLQTKNQVLAAVGVEETNMKSRRLALAVAEKESLPPTGEGEEMSGETTEDETEDEKRERLKREKMRAPLGIPSEDLQRITASLREAMKTAKSKVACWTNEYECDVTNDCCSK